MSRSFQSNFWSALSPDLELLHAAQLEVPRRVDLELLHAAQLEVPRRVVFLHATRLKAVALHQTVILCRWKSSLSSDAARLQGN